jgi:vacuolar-type H+-ATPase subunit E/Vma4
MSLQTILAAIEAQGELEVRQIEADAEAAVAKIRKAAVATAESRRQAAYDRALQPVAQERMRRMRQTHQAGTRLLAGAREQIVRQALDQLQQQLRTLCADAAYAEIYASLVTEAVVALQNEDGPLRIAANPRDHELIEKILPTLAVDPGAVEYSLDSWGGVEVRTIDGSIAISNTLESRFERALPQLRRLLAAELVGNFSENQTGAAFV